MESMPSDKKLKSLKWKFKSFFSNGRDIPELAPEPENSVEGIYPSLEEAELENSLERTCPALRRNMDANML